jgi:hypothetical protein
MRVVIVRGRRPPVRAGFAGLTERLGRNWCRWMHSEITWPVNGQYECRKCRRRFPVPWEIPAEPDQAAVSFARRPRPAVAQAA